MGRKYKSITQRKLEVLSARVNFEMYKKIEGIAHREDLNMTQIVRAALREYIDRRKTAEAA